MPKLGQARQTKRGVGYSTHGCWAPLNVIKELEVEDRGNEWFDDDGLDLSQYEGIWVCMKPEDAVCYALFAEDVGTDVHREAMRSPFGYVVEVNLTGACPVLDDGDSGWLYIKRKEKTKCMRLKRWYMQIMGKKVTVHGTD